MKIEKSMNVPDRLQSQQAQHRRDKSLRLCYSQDFVVVTKASVQLNRNSLKTLCEVAFKLWFPKEFGLKRHIFGALHAGRQV